MASAYTKAKLKESRDAIQKKQWDDARQAASDVLTEDKGNYNANVFLGLASLNLDRYEEAERAYQAAIASQPSQPLAYQGLEKFYTQRQHWDKLVGLLRTQADLALDTGDPVRCAECLQRILQIQREQGARSQRADALGLLLPGSPYHELLLSLPAPEPTKQNAPTIFEVQMAVHLESLKAIQEVVGLLEQVEQDKIDKEVEKKRMRIEGAGKSRDALRNEAGIEVWRESRLPALYELVLSHPDAANEDRREAEGKLLRYHHRLLLAFPPTSQGISPSTGTAARDAVSVEPPQDTAAAQKLDVRRRVAEMASGMVIVGVPDELAWSIHLEWQDHRSLADIPRHLLRQFVNLFPRAGRTQAFTALLLLLRDTRFREELEELKKVSDIDHGTADRDPLSLAIEGLEACPESILTARVASRLYLQEGDFTSANEIATSALVKARNLEREADVALPATQCDLKSVSGTALAHIYGSQNHAKAMRLLSDVLDHGLDVDALFTLAYIESEAQRWDTASRLFQQLKERKSLEDDEKEAAERILSLHKEPRIEAKGELAWCEVKLGRLEEGQEDIVAVIAAFDEDAHRNPSDQLFDDETRARAWWRAGECAILLALKGKSKVTDAFDCYITSIKRSPSFAPAFDSLGIYYECHQSPPDFVRSSKCYQKAFELDATQTHAAHKLAVHYADEREWDLVNVIARRVIEGEGGMAALSSEQATAASQKHRSQNAWAWKAIGIVRLEKSSPQEAINPLHIALRTDAMDASLWQRLGEAYSLTGRLTAALKAFERALELGLAEPWQTRYSIADIRREWGEFDEALAILDGILAERPDDFGVLAAAAETRLLKSRHESEMGLAQRAASSLLLALQQAARAIRLQPLLRSAWKVASDVCFDLSSSALGHDTLSSATDVLMELVQMAAEQDVDRNLPAVRVANMDSVEGAFKNASGDPRKSLLTICAYLNKLRVLLCASNDDLIGSAWADLAIVFTRLAKGNEPESRSSLVKEAIACAKEALNHEPANASFWLLLGNLTFADNFKVAQHAFVRAIESSLNDPEPWTNLGMLYLRNGDDTLADEAFIHAQTVDPQYARTWLGLALSALGRGETHNALSLFTQAVELSEGSVLEADYGLATTLFSSAAWSAATSQQMHTAKFALDSLLSHEPDHCDALHLSALYAERLGEPALAIERIEKAAGLLEGRFETSEDPDIALQFAVSQSNLARIRLAVGDIEGARSAADVALGLLADDEPDEGIVDVYEDGDDPLDATLTRKQRTRARFSADLTVAFCHSRGGESDKALQTLESVTTALKRGQKARPDGDRQALASLALTLSAQIQYQASRAEDAKATLLEAIAGNLSSLGIIVTLGAIALLEQDEDLLDAALSELGPQESIQDPRDAYIAGLLRSTAAFMAGRDGEALNGIEHELRCHSAVNLSQQQQGTARATGEKAQATLDRQLDFCEALLRHCLAHATEHGQPRQSSASRAKHLSSELLAAMDRSGPRSAHAASAQQHGRLLRLTSVLSLLALDGPKASATAGQSNEDDGNGAATQQERGLQVDSDVPATKQDPSTVDSTTQSLAFAREAVLKDPTESLSWQVLDIVQKMTAAQS
ncbi:unnamed protein product [Parajaminaea phylloscopi]